MRFEDTGRQIRLDDAFDTGSAGQVRLVEGIFEIQPQPEPVSEWFAAALEEHFGGAGVPREYACHIRVAAAAPEDQQVTLRFLFSQTNGKAYMDPPYWIRRAGRWWPIDARDTRFVQHESVELDVMVPAGGAVQVANKPYVTGDDVAAEMQQLAATGFFRIEQIGTTSQGRPLQRVNEALLALNQDWRVTPIERSTPLCEAGKFTNLAERFGTLAYCYQIYCVSEEATAWHASTVTMTLARALAGPEWDAQVPLPSIVRG